MDKIIQIIEKYAYNKDLVRNATLDSKIISDLKINSARIVDIILDIEDEFKITIDDNLLEKMITIKDVQEIIEQSIKNQI